jgi:integrase
MADCHSPVDESPREHPRSLPLVQWPDADRRAWEDACRPGSRLKPGGTASHLAQVTRETIVWRYGVFLGFLQQTGRLNCDAAAASHVTPSNVEAYVTGLTARVRSVTIHGYIQGLRRVAELFAPFVDFSWLADIEKDLKLVMNPSSKLGRLVLTTRLVEAGLTLVAEAQEFAKTDFARARGVRNGLIIALLAFCPIRLKNFASLEIGHTFKEINGTWWIALPGLATKSRRPDERRIPGLLNGYIDFYLNQSRPVLLRGKCTTNALWISTKTSGPMHANHVSRLISQVTLQTVGVAVSPHLFRTAAASTAAAYGGNTPHLASALLNHTDPRVTEEHYNRATSISASKVYAQIMESFLRD